MPLYKCFTTFDDLYNKRRDTFQYAAYQRWRTITNTFLATCATPYKFGSALAPCPKRIVFRQFSMSATARLPYLH
eukprot:2668190-Amphidinium_carterae.2